VEFLLTYGWAIMIMLAVVAVLFFLGIFSPNTLAPNSCTMPSGFSCYGYKVSDGGELWLDLGQSTGKGITVKRIACTAKEPVEAGDFVSVPDIYIKSGKHQSLSGYVHCTKEDGVSTPAEGEYYRGTIYIDYVDEDTQMSHRLKGDIAYRVERAATTPAPTPTPTPSPTPIPITSCRTIDAPGYYVVQNDLGSSDFSCITITSEGSGSTLDCQGRSITGSGPSAGTQGIYLTHANDVTIRNCHVSSYARGIYLWSSNGIIITGNTVAENNYGIALLDSNGTFSGNTACGNFIFDFYCVGSTTTSGSSIFDTNDGCDVTRTSSCGG
jgi:parallel beta-helix repeat protein